MGLFVYCSVCIDKNVDEPQIVCSGTVNILQQMNGIVCSRKLRYNLCFFVSVTCM